MEWKHRIRDHLRREVLLAAVMLAAAVLRLELDQINDELR